VGVIVVAATTGMCLELNHCYKPYDVTGKVSCCWWWWWRQTEGLL